MEGYKSLKAGQEVEFDLQQADKGFHAVNLRALSTERQLGTDQGSGD
jgi:CspA family cold shock protein